MKTLDPARPESRRPRRKHFGAVADALPVRELAKRAPVREG